MNKKLKVLMLVDLPLAYETSDYKQLMQGDDWRTEIDIYNALESNGHNVKVVGMFDDIKPLLAAVDTEKPDIVFNLAEHFNNNSSLERDVVGLLELLGLPYTGTGPIGLMLCKNKGLMKKLMAYHKIKTPRFTIMDRNKPIKRPKHLRFPIFVKPDKEDASYGISQASFVETDEALIDRVKFIHESMNQNALVEEYVDGRELYIGMLGNHKLKVFTPRELVFKEVPHDEPKIATFKAKWDNEYREKWGIENRFANPIPEDVHKKIIKMCKKVFRILKIRGYGRIDLRLTSANEIMIIEANPNPGISKEEELPLAAQKDGVTYNQFIQQILKIGLLMQKERFE